MVDLFTRRQQVYTNLRDSLAPIRQTLSPDGDAIANFLAATDEAKFLFGRDVMVFLLAQKDTLIGLQLTTNKLRDESLDCDERQRSAKEQHDQLIKVFEFMGELDRLMVPYMLMNQKRPFSALSCFRNYFWYD